MLVERRSFQIISKRFDSSDRDIMSVVMIIYPSLFSF